MIVKNKNGFTLIETIVSLTLLSMIVFFSLSMITTSVASKNKVDSVMRDQVALRLALLTITKDIRKDPTYDNDNRIEDRYDLVDGVIRRSDNSVVVEDIDTDGFKIYPIDKDGLKIEPTELDIEGKVEKVEIHIRSVGGQKASTVVHLRIGL